jgi:hypothetical protein
MSLSCADKSSDSLRSFYYRDLYAIYAVCRSFRLEIGHGFTQVRSGGADGVA